MMKLTTAFGAKRQFVGLGEASPCAKADNSCA
jgi:hypothetical protein